MTLVEYGDYECPYCRAAVAIVQELQRVLPDHLRFVFRHFPLENLHPHARRAAEAAEAAASQGKFFEMHAALFEHQTALEDEDLLRYAAELDLDTARFGADLDAHTYAGRVREDFRGGVRSGVRGTPTFYLDDVRYDGVVGVRQLVAAIRESHPDLVDEGLDASAATAHDPASALRPVAVSTVVRLRSVLLRFGVISSPSRLRPRAPGLVDRGRDPDRCRRLGAQRTSLLGVLFRHRGDGRNVRADRVGGALWPMDAESTSRHARRDEFEPRLEEVVVVAWALGGLITVTLLLFLGGTNERPFVALLPLAGVAMSWAGLHLLYAARYAYLLLLGRRPVGSTSMATTTRRPTAISCTSAITSG